MKKSIHGTVFLCAFTVFLCTACPPAPIEQFVIPPRQELWYYVSSTGNDAASGLTEEEPFKTLGRAAMAAASDVERPRVYILDTLDTASEGHVSAAEVFLIDGSLVRREITLSAEAGAGLRGDGTGGKSVLRVQNSGHIIIKDISIENGGEAGLVLEGASGVLLQDGFIGNNLLGVSVHEQSVFVMTGGSIEENINFAGSGGGVCVEDSGSSFTMTGDAVISNNTAVTGAAVIARNHARFIMDANAWISGNTSIGTTDTDSCVYIGNYSSFTMTGNAAVESNSARSSVALDDHSVFVMEGDARVADNISGYGLTMENFGECRMSGKSSITDNVLSGVNSTGSLLIMREESRVSRNSSSGVAGSANFLMTDNSEVSYNLFGGIVLQGSVTLDKNARVTMNRTTGDGGGIYLTGDALTLTDNAVISRNTAGGKGGGVAFWGNTMAQTPALAFIMGKNVSIVDNTATGDGGGVYLYSAGFFMDENARIAENRSLTGSGGGVAIGGGAGYWGGASFIMRGGSLSDNHAETAYGGGVVLFKPEVSAGATSFAVFTMDGGFISGNTANKGGGVAVQNVGNFSKAAGPSVRIYGNNAAPLFKNTALAGGGEGHAVWVSENDAHTTSAFRDVTVDEGDSLSQPYSAW